MEQEKLAVNVKEMAKMLGISAQSAYNLAKTPGFPVVRIGKRQLVPTDALKKWLEEQKNS
ncbi:MAG: helix-turn-helix domain-containing protein [Clostridia bacterium]|nr:helix-turn-helix domain-containing protein [Clostridia bacterium]